MLRLGVWRIPTPTPSPMSLRNRSLAPPIAHHSLSILINPLWFCSQHLVLCPLVRSSHLLLAISSYLALRLKIIAVSPGRYRWRCYCAAAESSEHLGGFSCSRSTDRAVDPDQPRGGTRAGIRPCWAESPFSSEDVKRNFLSSSCKPSCLLCW